MKRIIISLSDEFLDTLDEAWKKLGLPSRNSYVEQCIRYQLKLPNIFQPSSEGEKDA